MTTANDSYFEHSIVPGAPYESKDVSDIPKKNEGESSATKPQSGVYRVASVKPIIEGKKIKLEYDGPKERLKNLYLNANLAKHNAAADTKHRD